MDDFKAWLTHKGYSPNTVRVYASAVRGWTSGTRAEEPTAAASRVLKNALGAWSAFLGIPLACPAVRPRPSGVRGSVGVTDIPAYHAAVLSYVRDPALRGALHLLPLVGLPAPVVCGLGRTSVGTRGDVRGLLVQRTRWVPLSPAALEVLDDYLAWRDGEEGVSASRWLFPSAVDPNVPIPSDSARWALRRLRGSHTWTLQGLAKSDGAGVPAFPGT